MPCLGGSWCNTGAPVVTMAWRRSCRWALEPGKHQTQDGDSLVCAKSPEAGGQHWPQEGLDLHLALGFCALCSFGCSLFLPRVCDCPKGVPVTPAGTANSLEALITSSAPHPELSCLPSLPSCPPHWRPVAASGMLLILWGCGGCPYIGADVAHGEGLGLRGAAFSTAAPVAPSTSFVLSLQTCCLTCLQLCGSLENANMEKNPPFPHST